MHLFFNSRAYKEVYEIFELNIQEELYQKLLRDHLLPSAEIHQAIFGVFLKAGQSVRST